MDIDLIFEKLLDFYKVSSAIELAQKMQVSQQAISGWRSRNSISAVRKKCRELGIYDEIFGDINTSFTQHGSGNQQIGTQNNRDSSSGASNNENIKKLFNIAYQELNESDESKEFLNCLTSFILLNRVAKKFKNPVAEKNFLMKLFKGKMDEFAILKILGKSLAEAKVTPELSKSKEQLLKIIDNYHLKLVQDKLFNWLNEADKSNLKKWIETELDDLDCFVILSNIPNVLKLLTDEITVLGILNKNEFKMPY